MVLDKALLKYDTIIEVLSGKKGNTNYWYLLMSICFHLIQEVYQYNTVTHKINYVIPRLLDIRYFWLANSTNSLKVWLEAAFK